MGFWIKKCPCGRIIVINALLETYYCKHCKKEYKEKWGKLCEL